MSDQSSTGGHDHSRRDFMRGSAGIAAGAAMANLVIPTGVFAQSDETVKVALIGAGGRGTGAANQALNTKGPVKLIAVADAFEDNARNGLQNIKKEQEKTPERVDVKDENVFWGFDAYEKAIAAGPDMVILATPPGFRPIHFEAAVKAGKHVFMEKPVATGPEGVRQVLATAEEAKRKNLKVAVGLQRHHDPKYIETVRRIQDGELGDIILARAYWNDGGVWVRPRKKEYTEMEYQMRNWYYFNWLCGDHINEQHIHNLDVINWIKNDHPVNAQGVGGRQVRNGIDHGEIYDHHMVEYTYADGTVMMSECRHQPKCWNSVSEHAHGQKGYANVSAGQFMMKDGSSWRFQGQRGGQTDPYQLEHDHLFDALRNNKAHNEAFFGAHSTMTAILGRMATYSGQNIKYDDALKSQISIMPKQYDFKATPPTLPGPDGRYPIPTPGVTKVI